MSLVVEPIWNFYTYFTGIVERQWYHVACVNQVGAGIVTTSLYVNGDFIASDAATASSYFDTSGEYRIGYQRPTFNRYYVGNIDDVAHWTAALSQAEISMVYNRQKQKYASHYDSGVIDLGSITFNWPDLSWSTSLPFGKELVGDFDSDGNPDSESSFDYFGLSKGLNIGLVTYLNLNETNLDSAPLGKDYLDLSGYNNHGEEFGGVSLGVVGKLSKSAQFDGVDDRVILDNDPSLNFGTSTNFTLSGWVKSNGSGSEMFISKDGGLDGHFTTFVSHISTSRPRGYLKTPSPSIFCTVDGSISINDGKWHHLTFVFNRSNNCDLNSIEIYIDGVKDENTTLLGSATASNFDISNTNPLRIGYRTSSEYLTGFLDEIAIWNRSLNNTEVQQLYRRGANRIKFQLKSCVNSNCECKSLSVSPAGSASDCDGDTIVNALDFDDIHKAEFVGPGGDGTTYYSELFNRKATNLTFNCGINSSDRTVMCV